MPIFDWTRSNLFHEVGDGSTALFYEKSMIQDDYNAMAKYIGENCTENIISENIIRNVADCAIFANRSVGAVLNNHVIVAKVCRKQYAVLSASNSFITSFIFNRCKSVVKGLSQSINPCSCVGMGIFLL